MGSKTPFLSGVSQLTEKVKNGVKSDVKKSFWARFQWCMVKVEQLRPSVFGPNPTEIWPQGVGGQTDARTLEDPW